MNDVSVSHLKERWVYSLEVVVFILNFAYDGGDPYALSYFQTDRYYWKRPLIWTRVSWTGT